MGRRPTRHGHFHPLQERNGRFARVVASVLLRRAGFPRALIHSENKILSLNEFFDIVSKEVSARGAKARQRLQHPEERREEVRVQDEATAGAGGRKEERSGSM
ncbi:hypothetical protein Naga_101122g1 [Nannochloropsis gaditana]|uniref:Fido domain-containing protein n=1 Tax=Nannochloropsis gaditana TaxID=72520 RepID=W7T9S5_9STRA|nr:hypothetical protein Naga_101122g1 [Nannochloropsis gaditana]